MRAAVRYTLYRLALFAAAGGVLYLLGARGLLLVALALVMSGLVSYVVLSKQRDAFSYVISEKLSKARQQVDAEATAEDEAAAWAAEDEQRRYAQRPAAPVDEGQGAPAGQESGNRVQRRPEQQ